MNIKYKIFLLGVLLSTNIQAAILNKEEAAKADLTVLEDEVELFKSISMGINLSIAHCEGNDRCSLPIEEREVQQLVKTLEHRIDSLAARQSEIDDIIGFNKVLSSYISLRDSYTSFIEKIQSIIAEYKDKNEAFQYGSEPDFPVEAEIDEVGKRGKVSDVQLQKRILENLKVSAQELGFKYLGQAKSSIVGKKSGNEEFFLWLQKP